MAAYVELFMDQGATFSNIIYLNDDITNVPLDIRGLTVRSQMRRSYYSQNSAAVFTCTSLNPQEGEVLLFLTPDQTANVKAGRYLFDVEIMQDANNVTRVLEGIITVTPRVTK